MKKFPLIPLRDRVIILPDKAEEKTAGGIIIPDTAKERPRRGTVMASGIGLKDLPNETKPGDIVLFGKYGGTDIDHDGIDYLIMAESEILTIESKDKKKMPAKFKAGGDSPE